VRKQNRKTEPDRPEEPKTAANWLPNRAQPLQSRDRKKVQVDLKRNTIAIHLADAT